jgi:hypothetical protein
MTRVPEEIKRIRQAVTAVEFWTASWIKGWAVHMIRSGCWCQLLVVQSTWLWRKAVWLKWTSGKLQKCWRMVWGYYSEDEIVEKEGDSVQIEIVKVYKVWNLWLL